ncbi:MAG: signal peptidase I [Candidatus Geothermincolia bacterium]
MLYDGEPPRGEDDNDVESRPPVTGSSASLEEPEEPSPGEGEIEQAQPSRSRAWASLAVEVAVLFLIALTIAIFLQAFVLKAFVIPSPSMEPTLQEGDKVLVERASYHFGIPERGDIIVFRFNPSDPANFSQGGNWLTRSLDLLAETMNITHQDGTPFIKRVVGLPGETVEMRDGFVFIDGEQLVEEYDLVRDGYTGQWAVPADSVFVMGDNRGNSNDSRRWGFVPLKSIMGRAVLLWWPPSRWRSL